MSATFQPTEPNIAPPIVLRPVVESNEGARLLDDLRTFLCRFVAFPEPEQAVAVALWVMHTHGFEAAEATPRLSIVSAEKQSGKTRLLELLDLLVRAPLSVASISASAMFRLIAEGPVTLLIDEADTIFDSRGGRSEDLRGLLNAGYRRGGAVARVGGRSKAVERFRVFAPVALAGIGGMPDTVQDRSIIIRMKRRHDAEPVAKLRRREVEAEAFVMRSEIECWTGTHLEAIAGLRPEVPSELGDRASDIWEPLLAIAQAAGGDWLDAARCASVALAARGRAEERSMGVRLLTDLRRVLAECHGDRFASADLVRGLQGLDDGQWDDTIDPRSLARLLVPYDVRPKRMRFGDAVVRGYERTDFLDAFSRYLVPGEEVLVL
jgi:Protein of unknown function (DUF3631)